MDSLRETDPEFFEYLKENDASLLDFDGGSDDGDDDFDDVMDDRDEDDDDEVNEPVEESADYDLVDGDEINSVKERKVTVATVELIKSLVKLSVGGSLSSLRKLISIFRATCIPAENEDDEDDDVDKKNQLKCSYVVNDPEVYEYAMTEILENAHKSFYHILGLSMKDDNLKSILEKLPDHPKWKKTQFLVLSFFKSISHTLTSLSNSTVTMKSSKFDSKRVGMEKSDNQSGSVCSYLLKLLDPYIVLLAPLPRLSRRVLKVFLRLWAYGPSPEDDEYNVRGQSFLRIRQMVITLPGCIGEECFRGIYLTYARSAKSFSLVSASSVIFMAQCVTELYTLDRAQAYQQAFLYIRQLALHLRTAMMKKSPEATRLVLNWQYMNCLRLWTRVLCSQPKDDELKPLAFPLIQVLYGALSAAPSAAYIPFRFHVVSCLQQLAAHVKVFVPTASKLLEVLEFHEIMVEKPRASTDVPPPLQYSLRFSAGVVLNSPVREIIIQQTVTLLRYEAEIYRFHVGLPEYLYLTTRKLKAFIKKSKMPKWRDLARALCNQYDTYTSFAKENRVKLGVSPMEIQGFEPLLDHYNQCHKGSNCACAADRLGKLMSKDSTATLALQTTEEIVVPAHHGTKSTKSPVTAPATGALHAATLNARKNEYVAKKKAGSTESTRASKGGDNAMEDIVEAMEWSDDDA